MCKDYFIEAERIHQSYIGKISMPFIYFKNTVEDGEIDKEVLKILCHKYTQAIVNKIRAAIHQYESLKHKTFHGSSLILII